MREIKFRGKNLKGEWIIGAYVPAMDEDACDSIINTENPDGRIVMTDTVGQYTGLKDRKGEIYEGDVMRFITEFGELITSEVAFMDGFFYVQGEEDDNIHGITYAVESMNAEVIGNIHDNPELINPKE